jgi:predicted nucleic-acid-binding protein
VKAKAADTNILLRYFLQDDKRQSPTAKRFVENCTSDDALFINLVVLAELIWALKARYNFEKPTLVNLLDKMLVTEQFYVEQPEVVVSALHTYRQNNVDFADALIGAINAHSGYSSTATFDKKAAKLAEFELLP